MEQAQRLLEHRKSNARAQSFFAANPFPPSSSPLKASMYQSQKSSRKKW